MGRYDELQLIVTRGRSQTTTAESAATTSAVHSEEQQRSLLPTDVFESVTTTESTSELSPAERLVQEFHSAWSGHGTRTCSPGELVAPKECLAVYGFERATQLLPRVVKRMRELNSLSHNACLQLPIGPSKLANLNVLAVTSEIVTKFGSRQ